MVQSNYIVGESTVHNDVRARFATRTSTGPVKAILYYLI